MAVRHRELPIYGVQGAWAPRFASDLVTDSSLASHRLKSHLKSTSALLTVLSIGCVALSPVLMLLLTGQEHVSISLLVTLLATTALVSFSQSMTLAANAMGVEAGAARAWLAAGMALVLLGSAAAGVGAVAALNLAVVAVLAGGLVVRLMSRMRARRPQSVEV